MASFPSPAPPLSAAHTPPRPDGSHQTSSMWQFHPAHQAPFPLWPHDSVESWGATLIPCTPRSGQVLCRIPVTCWPSLNPSCFSGPSSSLASHHPHQVSWSTTEILPLILNLSCVTLSRSLLFSRSWFSPLCKKGGQGRSYLPAERLLFCGISTLKQDSESSRSWTPTLEGSSGLPLCLPPSPIFLLTQDPQIPPTYFAPLPPFKGASLLTWVFLLSRYKFSGQVFGKRLINIPYSRAVTGSLWPPNWLWISLLEFQGSRSWPQPIFPAFSFTFPLPKANSLSVYVCVCLCVCVCVRFPRFSDAFPPIPQNHTANAALGKKHFGDLFCSPSWPCILWRQMSLPPELSPMKGWHQEVCSNHPLNGID